MTCDHYKEQMTHWITNQMSGMEKIAFETHLSQCTECSQELADQLQVWKMMGNLPVEEPSELMRPRFQAMLEAYKEVTAEKGNDRSLWSMVCSLLFLKRGSNYKPQTTNHKLLPAFFLGYSVVLVVVGLTVGYYLTRKGPVQPSNTPEVAALSQQVHEMQQTLMLSLLENPSASERIRAVSYTSEINPVNKQVTNALFTTLNNDANVNVRLMALEALSHIINNPGVREGLVASIIQQDSPLVQSAMADLMEKLQEKRSVEPLKELLHRKDLNEMVRGRIEQCIKQII
jgi:hypothetical protein